MDAALGHHRRYTTRSFATLMRQAGLEATNQQLVLGKCIGDVTQDLARVVRRVDRGIREVVRSPSSRATMVACAVADGRAWFVHTGDGDVCLLRDGQVHHVVGSPPPLPGQVPWVGAREAEAELASVGIWASEEGLQLQPGDRLVLSSAALRPVFDLAILVGGGPAAIAAQALSQVLRRREGRQDVAVGIVDWGRAPEGPEQRAVPVGSFSQREVVTEPMEFNTDVDTLNVDETPVTPALPPLPPFRSVQAPPSWVPALLGSLAALGCLGITGWLVFG